MRRPPPRRRFIAAPPLQLHVRLPLRAAAQLLLLSRRALVLAVLLIDAYDLLLLTSRISCGDVVVVDLRRRRSLLHAERAIHFVLRNDLSRLSQSSNAR